MVGEHDANITLALANLAETMRVQSEVAQEQLGHCKEIILHKESIMGWISF